MRKIIVLIIVLCMAVFLGACDNHAETMPTNSLHGTSIEIEDDTMLDKLYQIKKGWTEEQVCELLGEPNRQGGMSVVVDVYYTVDSTTEAAVYYWVGEQGLIVTKVDLINSESGEHTAIL